jgi:hypothetical protein
MDDQSTQKGGVGVAWEAMYVPPISPTTLTPRDHTEDNERNETNELETEQTT